MKTAFRPSFLKDFQNIGNLRLRQRIRELIQSVENAESLAAIPNLKKMHGPGSLFRIRVGDYRIGIVQEFDTVTFARCLNRKDIYKYFP